MSRETTIEELQKIMKPLKEYEGSKIQHVKTSGWYRIVSFHFRESDMSVEFVYETCHREPVRFSRPLGELFDGRFSLPE